ncbi:hypothetical protein BDA96_01G360000 [Sorghum bicolor]|uniref:Uncharacterized protein n=2 Tax=Sorghum bicolor TaxID=4558 RepID=A0A921S529_SORBI|nr:hypothetical protein BDA96_01G360000 [Sorghum bicolor]OQU92391.1 hypothetical protein SORBI_3001G336450 [Sorghum bicolor]
MTETSQIGCSLFYGCILRSREEPCLWHWCLSRDDTKELSTVQAPLTFCLVTRGSNRNYIHSIS